MPNVYNETMNVDARALTKFMEKSSFPVGVIMNAKIKGKVVKVGGEAFAEIVQAPRLDDNHPANLSEE